MIHLLIELPPAAAAAPHLRLSRQQPNVSGGNKISA
jgi:hypothetical protein